MGIRATLSLLTFRGEAAKIARCRSTATASRLRTTPRYAAWNAHDPDAIAAVFAADAELLDAGSPEPVRGRDAIRARAAGLLEAFGDFHLERLHLLIDPPCNADRWRVTAVHSGDFLGLAPTGRKISVEGCTFSTFGADGAVSCAT